MTWSLSDKEFASVLSLPGVRRYAYGIKKMADTEEVWGLWQEDRGWALAADDSGNEVFPIWPHERYAETCATGSWKSSLPRVIALEEWIKRWIPGLSRDQRLISLFPSSDEKGVVVTPERLREDLEAELDCYDEELPPERPA